MKGAKWGPREDALLRDLTMQGVPVKEIAQRLGRTTWAVYSRREALLKENEPAPAATGTSSVGNLHEIAERLSYTYIIHPIGDNVKGKE